MTELVRYIHNRYNEKTLSVYRGKMMIRVLLVDDHVLIRTGIRRLLQDAKAIKIIGEASTGEEAIKLSRELRPHVVLLDFRLPDITGLEVMTRLLRIDSDLKILIFSSLDNALFPFRALDRGAYGYLNKDTSPKELLNAIKTVYAGKRVISSSMAARLALAKMGPHIPDAFQLLTNKEMEVAMMTIRGISVPEISERLHLSGKTVHTYRSHIFSKLNVNNDVALVLLAVREGLMAIEEV